MPRGEHEHEHAEEFPRSETASLVGSAFADEERRTGLQAAIVAVAIVLLALAFPTELVFGRTIELVESTARGAWSGPHLGSQTLAELLHALGLRAEPAWFLLSALGFGAAAWILLRGAARRGWPAGPRLLALGGVVFTPIAMLAATTPSAAGLGCFGACLLFESLHSSTGERPKVTRAAAIWLVASLFHAWNGLLLPAVLLACGRRSWRPLSIAVAVWLAFVVGASAIEGGRPYATLHHLRRTLLAGGSGGPGPLLAWIGVFALGFGGGTMAWLEAHAFGVRVETRRPPAWMLAFGVVPLALLGLGGVVTWDVPCAWLLPLAYFGLVGLQRSRRTAALAILAIFGLVGALGVRLAFDEERSFRAAVEHAGHAGLVVLTHDPARVYLLEQRYDLEAIDLSPALTLDDAARAVFLAEVEARIATLRARGQTVVHDLYTSGGSSSSRSGPDSTVFMALVQRTGIEPLR